MTMTSRLC